MTKEQRIIEVLQTHIDGKRKRHSDYFFKLIAKDILKALKEQE